MGGGERPSCAQSARAVILTPSGVPLALALWAGAPEQTPRSRRVVFGVHWYAEIGAAVGFVLLAVIAIRVGRSRSAEDELRQPKGQPARTATPGSFDSSSLRRWLLSAKAARRTGTLQLTADGRTCSLYFLFGHLFHVASDALTGEPALQDCLSWQNMQYSFDAKAKLPTEETIARPVDQILA
jgi:hypothetical protein